MRFILNGSATAARLARSTPAKVQAFNDDGSPLALPSVAVLDIFNSATAADPVAGLIVTPDGTLGAYGYGTSQSPTLAGLASGSTVFGRLRLDDNTGTSGQLVGVTLTVPGTYRTKPVAAVDGQGTGTGATITVTMTPGPLTGIDVVNGASGFQSDAPPTVTLTGGSPSVPAVARAVVSGPIATVAVSNPGLFRTPPTSITAANGSGAILTPVLALPTTAVNITAAGSGYTNGTWQILPGHGLTGWVVVSGGAVTDVIITSTVGNTAATPLGWFNKSLGGTGFTCTYTKVTAPIALNSVPVSSVQSTSSNNGLGISTLPTPVPSQMNTEQHWRDVLSQCTFRRTPAGAWTVATPTTIGSDVYGSLNVGGTATFTFGTQGVFTGFSVTLTHTSLGVFSASVSGSMTSPVLTGSSGGKTVTVELRSFRIDYGNPSQPFKYHPGPYGAAAYGSQYGYLETHSATVTYTDSGFENVPQMYWSNGETANGFDLMVANSTLNAVTVTAGGIAYLTGGALTFTGGSVVTTPVANIATINGSVTSIVLDYPGLNYQEAPTVVVTGGVTATARMNTSIASLAVGTAGSGYIKTPQLVLTGGGPTVPGAGVLRIGRGNDYFSVNRIQLEVE